MEVDSKKALRTLNPRSVWLPVIIGLAIVTFIAFRDDKINEESLQSMLRISILAIVLAFLFLISKDLLNTARVKLVGNGAFGIKEALRIVFLWEFAIAVVPPIIGPVAVVIYIIHKHGVDVGRALAYALLLAMMDNIFFLTASPIALLLTNGAALPQSELIQNELGGSLSYFFYLSYGLIAFYISFKISALLLFPSAVKNLLQWLAQLPFLKKWGARLSNRADELYEVSKELRGKTISFWLKLVGLTYALWIVKLGVLNMLVVGFVPISLNEHLTLLSRHLIMWLVMLVSPTPGSAGTAEYIFPAFFEDFLGEYTFVASLIWRLISFYPYLIIGALILPGWIKKLVGKNK
ncbi:lysylphosphatidylglycerol synthase transmembrane domain-containing protein [uncultured Roseivirga sp.]|uniref:lysylphosphatidylglycerol synthase transmembrane domain-containing protein n=1 Tax=uncultured Roseivirga sp. TaxID=543088 RepID=UPI0030D76982|tara:strand:- start:4592 stop:5641 length:1050 start_codon:yes stop_codon:yes gene_type:complete